MTRFIASAPAIVLTSSHPQPGAVWSKAPGTCLTWRGRWRAHAESSHLKVYRPLERLLREQCHINEADPELATLKEP